MEFEAVRDRMGEIIGGIVFVPGGAFDPAKSFDANGVDSLDKIEILMMAEEEWNIEITDPEAKDVSSVEEAAWLVAGKLGIERKCQHCGCTDRQACTQDKAGNDIDPCHWAAPHVCSACTEPKDQAA